MMSMTLSSSFFLATANIYGKGGGRMAVVKWVEFSQPTFIKPWERCLSQIIIKSL